jgi:hypothetical protein
MVTATHEGESSTRSPPARRVASHSSRATTLPFITTMIPPALTLKERTRPPRVASGAISMSLPFTMTFTRTSP